MDSINTSMPGWIKRYLYTFTISSVAGLLFGLVMYLNSKNAGLSIIAIPMVLADSIGLSCITAFFLFGNIIEKIKNNIVKFITVCVLLIIASVFGNELSSFIVNK